MRRAAAGERVRYEHRVQNVQADQGHEVRWAVVGYQRGKPACAAVPWEVMATICW